jgi:hypothetical protein
VPSTIGVDGEMLQSTEQWILLYRSIYGSSGPTAGLIYGSQPLHRRGHGLGADAVAGGAAGGVGGGETTLVTRDDLPDADSTLPTAINNKGEVVHPRAINDDGVIAGETSSGGFVRLQDGTFVPVDHPSVWQLYDGHWYQQQGTGGRTISNEQRIRFYRHAEKELKRMVACGVGLFLAASP